MNPVLAVLVMGVGGFAFALLLTFLLVGSGKRH